MTVYYPMRDQRFLNLMKEFGYSINETGMCFGLAHMTKQAALVPNGLVTFDKRLRSIEILLYNTESINDLTPQEKLDLAAFFDGIMVYHNINVEHLFDKRTHQGDLTESHHLISPFDSAEGIIALSPSVTLCTENETIASLNALNESLENLKQPVSIVFVANQHAISVSYDPRKKAYYFCDANDLPGRWIDAKKSDFAKELTKEIRNAFFIKDPNQPLVLASHFYTNQSLSSDVVSKITDPWRLDNRTLSQEEANKLVPAAIFSNDVKTFESIVDPRKTFFSWIEGKMAAAALNFFLKNYPDIIPKALELAMTKELDDVLLGLLKNDIKLDNSALNQILHIAVKQGNLDLAKRAVEQRANVGFQPRNHQYLIDIALKNNDKEMMRFLLSKGAPNAAGSPLNRNIQHASWNEETRFIHNGMINSPLSFKAFIEKQKSTLTDRDALGRTPLHYATELAKRGDTARAIEATKLLIENGSPLDVRDKLDDTPLDLVLASYDEKMVDFFCDELVHHNVEQQVIDDAIFKALQNTLDSKEPIQRQIREITLLLKHASPSTRNEAFKTIKNSDAKLCRTIQKKLVDTLVPHYKHATFDDQKETRIFEARMKESKKYEYLSGDRLKTQILEDLRKKFKDKVKDIGNASERKKTLKELQKEYKAEIKLLSKHQDLLPGVLQKMGLDKLAGTTSSKKALDKILKELQESEVPAEPKAPKR